MPQTKKWTPEATQTLVSLYKLQPTLYKTDCANYRNKTLRYNALDSIRLEINQQYNTDYSHEEIAKKIANARTQFMDVHRSTQKKWSGMGTEDAPEPTWWLYEELKFLLPYFKKTKVKLNMQYEMTSTEESSAEAPDEEMVCWCKPKRQHVDSEGLEDDIHSAAMPVQGERQEFGPEIASLCNFIGHELASFKYPKNLQKCKWSILKVIQDMQEEESHES